MSSTVPPHESSNECPQDIPQDLDLLVVGAGVYGAWSALHARRAGLKVLLVDRGDIAGESSCSSTKLIHGGLRYLEHGEFSMVKKSLKERQALKLCFPHLFQAAQFFIPLAKREKLNTWKMRLGLWLYDHLAGGPQPVVNSGFSTRQQAKALAPHFESAERLQFMRYGDGITDDHRLCLHVVLSYLDVGGHLRTHADVDVQDLHENKGVRFHFKSDPQRSYRAKKVLYCIGRSTTGILKESETPLITKGVHILVPASPIHDALLLKSPIDGRYFFMLPWYGRTMIGTTDTEDPSSERAIVKEADVQYLLDSANHHLSRRYQRHEVIASFAGHRVLSNPKSTSPSAQSRGWEWKQPNPFTFISCGGKLTSARVDALELLQNMYPKHDVDTEAALWGHSSPSRHAEAQKTARSLGIGQDTFEQLYFRYGSNCELILEDCAQRAEACQLISEDLLFIWAEIDYILLHEHVKHGSDLIRRRIPLCLLLPYDESLLRRIIDRCQDRLGWSQQSRDQEQQQAEHLWRSCCEP